MSPRGVLRPSAAVVASGALLILGACSLYQSYHDTGSGDLAGRHQRWEVRLPYDSGKGLVIHATGPGALVLADAQKRFHLTRIPLAGDGSAGEPLYLLLDRGDRLQPVGEERLLVVDDDSDEKHVTLVDAATLSPLLSATLSFFTDADLVIPGTERLGDVVAFYSSAVKIGRHTWQDGQYRYTTPYVAAAHYDLHLVDTTQGKIASFPAIAASDLDQLAAVAAASYEAATSRQRAWLAGQPAAAAAAPAGEPDIERFLFLIDQLFLVDGGRTLIVSFASRTGEGLYYLLDVAAGARSMTWHTARELVARYPHEFTLVERAPRALTEEAQPRDLTIRGMTYRPERFAVFEDGVVVVARPKTGESDYSRQRCLLGLRLLDSGPERLWERCLSHGYAIDRLIEDRITGTVYLPEQASDGSLEVIGLRVATGRKLPGFPANFRTERSDGETTVSLAGTVADFSTNRLYLHDRAGHRIVCADLWPDG